MTFTLRQISPSRSIQSASSGVTNLGAGEVGGLQRVEPAHEVPSRELSRRRRREELVGELAAEIVRGGAILAQQVREVAAQIATVVGFVHRHAV
jgi:hypothetical protein